MELCNVEIYNKNKLIYDSESDICNDIFNTRQKKISRVKFHFFRILHTSLSWKTAEHSYIYGLSTN